MILFRTINATVIWRASGGMTARKNSTSSASSFCSGVKLSSTQAPLSVETDSAGEAGTSEVDSASGAGVVATASAAGSDVSEVAPAAEAGDAADDEDDEAKEDSSESREPVTPAQVILMSAILSGLKTIPASKVKSRTPASRRYGTTPLIRLR